MKKVCATIHEPTIIPVHTDYETQRYIDIVARLSVYTVPSSDPSHRSLVPNFLPPKTSLHRTLVVIVLDWTKPWSFLDQLKTWLSWVEEWSKQDPSREVQVLREEGRERCKLHSCVLRVDAYISLNSWSTIALATLCRASRARSIRIYHHCHFINKCSSSSARLWHPNPQFCGASYHRRLHEGRPHRRGRGCWTWNSQGERWRMGGKN